MVPRKKQTLNSTLTKSSLGKRTLFSKMKMSCGITNSWAYKPIKTSIKRHVYEPLYLAIDSVPRECRAECANNAFTNFLEVTFTHPPSKLLQQILSTKKFNDSAVMLTMFVSRLVQPCILQKTNLWYIVLILGRILPTSLFLALTIGAVTRGTFTAVNDPLTTENCT